MSTNSRSEIRGEVLDEILHGSAETPEADPHAHRMRVALAQADPWRYEREKGQYRKVRNNRVGSNI